MNNKKGSSFLKGMTLTYFFVQSIGAASFGLSATSSTDTNLICNEGTDKQIRGCELAYLGQGVGAWLGDL